MHDRSRASAKRLRAQLLTHRPSPESFRSALNDVATDDWDPWLDLVLDLDVLDDQPDLPRGCVPYLPCPVATVMDALDQANVTSTDVFVDVGAGMGRTLMLANLTTGAGCIGIEVQASLTKVAAGRADWLNLTRARFIHGDAVELVQFLMTGTVFFLYCPFGGERLGHVLSGLEGIARTRSIRICCVAMAPLELPWLRRVRSTSREFELYRSVAR